MEVHEVKLSEISEISIGLPIIRYKKKDNLVKKDVIQPKSIENFYLPFNTQQEDLSENIKEKFYSKEHDILYKAPHKSFAKEITTETNLIIPNTYIIIRPNLDEVNSTFLAQYLNDPRVDYEIQRYIDSTIIPKVNITILKNLRIFLPEREIQDKYANLISSINKRIVEKRKSITLDEEIINSEFTHIIGDSYE